MPEYKYRALTVGRYDPGFDWRKERRKPGKESMRWYEVEVSGRSEPLYLTDEVGDDLPDFTKRGHAAFVDYLNALGNDGWKLVSYTRDIEALYGANETRRWPIGTYLFIREQQ